MDVQLERDEFDYVTLAGVRSPGRAEVSNGKLTVQYDEESGAGIDGATLKYKGVGLGELDVKFTLWEDQHWIEWETFRELLKPPREGQQPVAMDGDDGAWACVVKFKAYRKPKPILGNSNTNGSIDKPGDEENPFQFGRNALLDALLVKAEKLEAEDVAQP